MSNLQIIYIHGLGSSSEKSSKFKAIKEHFANEANVIGFDWLQSDDLGAKIKTFISSSVDLSKPIMLIGSSAGGKVAQLFKYVLNKFYKTFAMTVLLNPLADIKNRTTSNRNVITNDYLKYGELHCIQNEMLIIYSENDEMIDQLQNVKEFNQHNKFLNVGYDDHRLSNSTETILEAIDVYRNAYMLM